MDNILSANFEKNRRVNFDKDQFNALVELLVTMTKNSIESKANLDTFESKLTPLLTLLRQKVTQQAMEAKDVSELTCGCGEKMVNKEKCSRKIVGLATYTISRRSFYCPLCKKYEKPLDKALQIRDRFSLEVKKAMVLLGQRLPFEESSHYLKELMKVTVSHESIQTLVETTGQKIADAEQVRVDEAIDSDGFIKNWEDTQTQKGTAYMELDGCMVQTREEKWKEVRNGMLFRDCDRAQADKHHKTILTKRYFSVFNSADDSIINFKNRSTQEAYEFKFHQFENAVILGDGARWIWDYANEDHPYAIQILDYYHASEYLGHAISSLKIENKNENKKVEKRLFDWLYDGKINPIISFLLEQTETAQVQDCVRYYQNNCHRMRYKYFRDLGLDIGSGSIESAHRTIVQCRMKQAGMYWGKHNVQSMVSLRAKYLSGDWNEIVEDYLMVA